MTLYIAVDIHARQQTLSYLDSSGGTTGQVGLDHERDNVREVYFDFYTRWGHGDLKTFVEDYSKRMVNNVTSTSAAAATQSKR